MQFSDISLTPKKKPNIANNIELQKIDHLHSRGKFKLLEQTGTASSTFSLNTVYCKSVNFN